MRGPGPASSPSSNPTAIEATNIEGLADGDEPPPAQQEWIGGDVSRCGYRRPGPIMVATLLPRASEPADEDIDRIENVCRCGSSFRIREGIERAANREQSASTNRQHGDPRPGVWQAFGMRIATWNVNSVGARLPRLLGWLDSAAPDVVCLQELKCASEAFPTEAIAELGYEAAAYGTGRWNGVAVLSRIGIDDVRRGLLDEPRFQADGAPEPASEPRAIAATCGGVRVWSVYVPNGREVDHPHYTYKLAWLEQLRATATEELDPQRPLAVLGDFNIAPTDEDVWDIARFTGCTHVTDRERKTLTALCGSGLTEVYPRALKYDVPFTYWDYRALAFPKNRGMRIDLVYGDEKFADAVTDSYVDREERKGKGASDHAPVVVDLEL